MKRSYPAALASLQIRARTICGNTQRLRDQRVEWNADDARNVHGGSDDPLFRVKQARHANADGAELFDAIADGLVNGGTQRLHIRHRVERALPGPERTVAITCGGLDGRCRRCRFPMRSGARSWERL